jgi:transposase
MGKGASTEQVVREIQRRTRRRFSAEEKVRIVLEGLRGEQSVAELCRREGLAPNLYYRWSKEFLEAGKKRLLGDTMREATAPEVKALRDENGRLKQALAETVLGAVPVFLDTGQEGAGALTSWWLFWWQ